MGSNFLKLIAILVLASLACNASVNLPASSPGELRTAVVDEAAPEDGAQAQVRIEMAGGTLEITGGGTSLVNGTIEYNLVEWEPEVLRETNTVRIEQNVRTLPLPRRGNNIINRWALQLGSTPIDLQIDAGAYEGTLDLSGVALTRLGINSGASNTTIRFDTPNPERMALMEFRTGASNVELTGLGNANFAELRFRGAAGNYVLDFSGQYSEPGRAVIEGAVGDLTVIVPAGQSVHATVTGGMRNVDTQGEWQILDNEYTTGSGSPMLDITVNMSVGSLRLISR
jgi:hypothetical protein